MDRLPRHAPHSLLSNELFAVRYNLPPKEQAALSYERAKSLALVFGASWRSCPQLNEYQLKFKLGLTRADIEDLTPTYWRMNIDPILLLDGAATTLLTIQLNLVAGTIAAYAHDRPDLSLLLEKLLRFDIWSVP